MKKRFYYAVIFTILCSGCTKVITAPMQVTGRTVGASIHAVGSDRNEGK